MTKNSCHPGRARSAKIRDQGVNAGACGGPGSALGFADLVRDDSFQSKIINDSSASARKRSCPGRAPSGSSRRREAEIRGASISRVLEMGAK